MLTSKDPFVRDVDASLRRHAERELVRYAAATAITCPSCETIMDAAETVVASDGDRKTLVLCAACWGKPPMALHSGSVEVLDGRLLYRRARQHRSTRFWKLKG